MQPNSTPPRATSTARRSERSATCTGPIAAFVADAQHLDPLRLRLRQLFEHFTVGDEGATIALVPTRLRDDALDAVMADVSGLRRKAVRATTHANGLPLASVNGALAGPIPIQATDAGTGR